MTSINYPYQGNISSAPILKVLHTRHFRKAFLSSLSRLAVSISIVSPFVTPLPGFASPYKFFESVMNRLPMVTCVFVTAPPDNRKNNVLSWEEASLIENLGVNIAIRPTSLHSKLYYIRYQEGDSSSFVGSANFTKGGFEGNDETVAYWRRSEPDAEVERELARLTGPGSFNLLQWKLESSRGIKQQENYDGD